MCQFLNSYPSVFVNTTKNNLKVLVVSNSYTETFYVTSELPIKTLSTVMKNNSLPRATLQ